MVVILLLALLTAARPASLIASAFVAPITASVYRASSSLSTSSSSSAATTTETISAESASSLRGKDLNDNDDLLVLLDDALKFNSNNSSAALVADLINLRQKDPLAAESYLDDILTIVDSGINIRTIIPRFSTRLSRKARLRSMSKVLKMSTPSAENSAADDDVAAGQRRRRAVAVLLRAIDKESSGGINKKGTTIIRKIEKMAIKDAKCEAFLEDISNRVPPGLETPKYDVIVRRKSGYEIRNYEPYSVCTVEMKLGMKANDEKRSLTDTKVAMPQLAGASSFGALAGYLFGKNSQRSSMKMTTPVLTSNAGLDVADATSGGGTKEMSFVLPSMYWSEDGCDRAPQPLDESGVRLQREKGGTRATLMFGGFANKAQVQEREKQLLTLLEGDEDFFIVDGATTTLSQYNDVSWTELLSFLHFNSFSQISVLAFHSSMETLKRGVGACREEVVNHRAR